MIVGIICCNSTNVSAINSLDQDCTAIESVFARGSGDTGNTKLDDATSKFKDEITSKTKTGNQSLNFYALGTESYNNFQYPHIAINGWWAGDQNGLGALTTNGEGYDYGKSVDDGVGEMTAYLKRRIAKCPDSTYILGGYSQGAQVVGDSLSKLTKFERDKIHYVALFGNPKLNLPEGDSYTIAREGAPQRNPSPDACYGKGFSPWRHVIDNCRVTHGRLYAKTDAVYPTDIEARIHEWCFGQDGICYDGTAASGIGHGQYPDQRGIPDAVADALRKTSAIDENAAALATSISGNVDIRLYIDSFCSMGLPPGSEYLNPFNSLKNTEPFTSGRIALINSTTYPLMDYSEATINSQVATIPLFSDTPSRRPDAQLVNLIYTHKFCTPWLKAGFDWMHIPFPYSLARLSLQAPSPEPSAITRVITSPDDEDTKSLNPAMTATFTPTTTPTSFTFDNLIINSPFNISLQSNDYKILTGSTAYFTAMPTINNVSYYDWDFNGDGIYEERTTSATTTHAFDTPYVGLVQIRATNTYGVEAKTSANISVLTTYSRALLSPAPKSVTLEKLADESTRVSWVSTDSDPESWAIRYNDYPLARVLGRLRSVIISDLRFNVANTISIAGVNIDMIEGEYTSATLPAEGADEAVVTTQPGESPIIKKESAERFDLNKPIAQYESPLAQTGSSESSLNNVTKKFYPIDAHTHNNQDDSTRTPWTIIIAAAVVLTSLLTAIKLRK